MRELAIFDLCLHIGGGIMLYRRKRIFPISGRQTDPVILAVLLFILQDINVLLHALEKIPCPLYVWIRVLAQTTVAVTFILRGWQLYFKCKMNEKLRTIARIDYLDATLSEEAIGWHLSNRFLISRNVNFFVTVIIESAVFFGMIVAQVRDENMNDWDLVSGCNSFSIELTAAWGATLLQTMLSLLLIAAINSEGLFLKTEFFSVTFLSAIAAVIGLCVPVFGIQVPLYEDIALSIWCDLVFMCSVIHPLYLSYKTAKDPPQFGFESMEAVLGDPDGYNAFYQFLKGEFSTENLLFYSTVKAFQEQIDMGNIRAIKPLRDRAYQIYRNFLIPGAAYEVNVPHAARIAVADAFRRKFRRFSAQESKHSDTRSGTPGLDGSDRDRDISPAPRPITPRNDGKNGFEAVAINDPPSVNLAPDSVTVPQRPRTPRHLRVGSCPSALQMENLDRSPRDGSYTRNPVLKIWLADISMADALEIAKPAKEINVDELAAIRTIFDVPLQYVYHLMRTDSFGRFVLSSGYKDLLLSRAPTLSNNNRVRKAGIRPSISEEIHRFSEIKEQSSASDLLQNKQELHLKKTRRSPRAPISITKHSPSKQTPTDTPKKIPDTPPHPHSLAELSNVGGSTSELEPLSSSPPTLELPRTDSPEPIFTLPKLASLTEGGTPQSMEKQFIIPIKEVPGPASPPRTNLRRLAAASSGSSGSSLDNSSDGSGTNSYRGGSGGFRELPQRQDPPLRKKKIETFTPAGYGRRIAGPPGSSPEKSEGNRRGSM